MVRPSTRAASVASVNRAAVAGGALDADVGQVLDIKVNVTEPPARRALALAGIEREVPWFPAPAAGVSGTGENAADLVERPRVSGRRRP